MIHMHNHQFCLPQTAALLLCRSTLRDSHRISLLTWPVLLTLALCLLAFFRLKDNSSWTTSLWHPVIVFTALSGCLAASFQSCARAFVSVCVCAWVGGLRERESEGEDRQKEKKRQRDRQTREHRGPCKAAEAFPAIVSPERRRPPAALHAFKWSSVGE